MVYGLTRTLLARSTQTNRLSDAWVELDRRTLAAAAPRSGPLPDDLLGSHVVDPRITDHWSGLRKSLQLHDERLVVAIPDDIERIERDLLV